MVKLLSVIIVTYNSKRLIFDCIDSLYKHNDIGDGLEIIIVDNSSADREDMFSSIREKYLNDVILIESPVNGGYGHGNNQGINASSANHVVVMNPDVRLVNPIFKNILTKFEQDRNIALLGVGFVDGSRCLYFKPEYNTMIKRLLYSLYVKKYLYKVEQMFFSGSFLVFDKKTFLKAGAFDENIFMYNEEPDISNRILNIGKKTVLAKDVFVFHLAHGRDVNPFLMKVGAESRKYYCAKYCVDLNLHYKRELFFFRVKYIVAVLINNKLKKAEFLAWIKLCENNGEL